MHIAIDPGSTHMGKKKFVKEIIEKCKEAGVDSVKFQLFPNESRFLNGNVWMSPDLFNYAIQQGKVNKIPVTASVFGKAESEFLATYDVPYVKFSHSMKHEIFMINGWLGLGKQVVVTSDMMSIDRLPEHENLITLWTATVDGKTLYPCNFDINFEGIFEKFYGFSDHTLGVRQAINAKKHGARMIEKHAGLKYNDVQCNDKAFCLDVNDLKDWVRAVK